MDEKYTAGGKDDTNIHAKNHNVYHSPQIGVDHKDKKRYSPYNVAANNEKYQNKSSLINLN